MSLVGSCRGPTRSRSSTWDRIRIFPIFWYYTLLRGSTKYDFESLYNFGLLGLSHLGLLMPLSSVVLGFLSFFLTFACVKRTSASLVCLSHPLWVYSSPMMTLMSMYTWYSDVFINVMSHDDWDVPVHDIMMNDVPGAHKVLDDWFLWYLYGWCCYFV